MLRTGLFIVAAVGIVPVAGLAALGAARYVTLYGWGYVLGLVLLVSGGFLSIKSPSGGRSLGAGGLGLLLLVFALRLFLAGQGERVRMDTMPGQRGTSPLNLIFDEQDVGLVGAHVLAPLGGVSASEIRAIPTLHRLYLAMRAEQEVIPSAFTRTYLGLQHPQGFDLLVYPPENDSPTVGVIFLHGFAGNLTLLCWLVAGAAREQGALTVCPSVGWRGDWWSAAGEATVRETIADLRARGIRRIYLAGLSNGGIGTSALAAPLEAELAGLIFISGVNPSAPLSGLPALVIHSRGDERIGYAVAERFVQRAGAQAELVSFEGDHFLLATHADEVHAAISHWLAVQEAAH